FAAAGYRVALHCCNSFAEGRALAEELGGICVQVDFHDMEAVSTIIPKLRELGFAPDVLVNSASSYRRGCLAETGPEMLRDMFAVNFEAPFELMRSFKEHCGKGAIINMTDQRTAYTDPAAGAYGLAKKALASATEAAALEWAPSIRVNALAPGLVLSPPGVNPSAIEKLLPKVPLQRRTTEDEVADACLMLAENQAMTGQTLYLDGGLHLLGHSVETVKKK
ncbi:MAG: SDR family oxidoreductase, partial [Victivallales bacterium]|nr:SDR family oxidoreductase [Victivallales bacterium]